MTAEGGNGRSEDDGQRTGRVLRRGGKVEGRVDALYPFLFVASCEASTHEVRWGREPCRDGTFMLAKPVIAIPWNVRPHIGAILPVACCRDLAMREGLMTAVGLLTRGPDIRGVDVHRQELEKVIRGGGLPARIVDGRLPGRYVELASLRALFPVLHGAFDHVSALWDDPKGSAEIAATDPSGRNPERGFPQAVGVSEYRLAKAMSVPPRRINEIVHGTRAITADTALRLGRAFGMEPLFWLNLQTRYDLETATDALADRLATETRPLSAVA